MASGDLLGDLLKIIGVVGVAIGGVWGVGKLFIVNRADAQRKRLDTEEAIHQKKSEIDLVHYEKSHDGQITLLLQSRAEDKREIETLRKEVDDLKQQFREIDKQLAVTATKKDQQQKQYDELTKQHADIMKTNADLHRENTQLHNENVQLKMQIELMNRKISKLTELLIELKPEYENLLTDTDEFLPVVVNKKT